MFDCEVEPADYINRNSHLKQSIDLDLEVVLCKRFFQYIGIAVGLSLANPNIVQVAIRASG
jgi:hypothetical protein